MVAKVRTGKPMLKEKVHVFWRSHHLYSSFWVVAPKRIHHEPSPLLKGLPSHKVRHSSPSLLKYRVSIACISLIPWTERSMAAWFALALAVVHPSSQARFRTCTFFISQSSPAVNYDPLTASPWWVSGSFCLCLPDQQVLLHRSLPLSDFRRTLSLLLEWARSATPLHPSQITSVSPLGMQTPSGQASVFHGPVHNLQCLELC